MASLSRYGPRRPAILDGSSLESIPMVDSSELREYYGQRGEHIRLFTARYTSSRPRATPAIGTAWPTAVAASPCPIEGAICASRAAVPAANGALNDVPHAAP